MHYFENNFGSIWMSGQTALLFSFLLSKENSKLNIFNYVYRTFSKILNLKFLYKKRMHLPCISFIS